MTRGLRCGAKQHAVLRDGRIEVKCTSRFCGAKPGIVVLHYFHTTTGDLLETKRYKDPKKEGAA